MHAWAWRVPSLIGGVLAIVGYFMRARLDDEGHQPDEDDDESEDDDSWPIVEAFTQSRRQAWLSILFTAGYGITFYLTMVYLPTFASKQSGMAESQALQINSLGLFVALLVVPLGGWISDRFIRRRTLLVGAFIAMTIIAWPLFWLVLNAGLWGLIGAQVLFALPQGLIMGIAPAMLVELFKGQYRLSGYSAPYNLGLGVAAGTSPLIATALISWTGIAMSTAWYLTLAAIIAVVGAWEMKDRSREPLR